ncbi:integrase [Orientia tsutsugamushi]|uniref:Integrase n=1 Tax=Orientia tsutsugamushi TaxID=784 RepID=A0A2U3RMU0_ORITS|nr:putative integrase domain protein [Orientia tsutsugamushi str. Karp]SPR14556.1 integrase [Orientia tsutsugamushi]
MWYTKKTKSKNSKQLYVWLADKLIEILKNRKLCSNSEWILPKVQKTIVNTYHIQQYTKHGIKLGKKLEYRM